MALALLVMLAGTASPPPPARAALAEGFSSSTVFGGLEQPTALAFAPDGRVFVGEQSGIIKVFDNESDTTPDVFADLQASVHNTGERGLLGLAINPAFPADPYVHAVYSYDADIGGQAPKWNDTCGTDGQYCSASGRLSRLRAEGNRSVAEEVLVEDWCSTGRFHSVAGLAFGPDGALYVSAGDGSYTGDYGQLSDPPNVCGDPPVGIGEEQKPPTAEGGSLRAQDLRTAGDPVSLDGTLIRVAPATGAPLPDNPLTSHPDPNAKRIVAHGLRMPFRLAFRPGTNQLWVGDVGNRVAEELNRVSLAPPGVVPNYGWPCYEGSSRQPIWEPLGVQICTDLYQDGSAFTPPVLSYGEDQPLFEGDTCPPAVRQALGGLAFYQGGAYPDTYDGALFLGDYGRGCMWVMYPGANGEPDPANMQTFATELGAIVDLKVGPGGDMFYIDIGLGEVRRISYGGASASLGGPVDAVAG
jgi:glucose/arabinose dehydrogenase